MLLMLALMLMLALTRPQHDGHTYPVWACSPAVCQLVWVVLLLLLLLLSLLSSLLSS
jgi:hypothetical protein